MEPSYDVAAVRAQRQRRITRTRVAAALASGVTFGMAVAAFAVHGHAAASTGSVVSTTPSTTPASTSAGLSTTTTTVAPDDSTTLDTATQSTVTPDTVPQPAVPSPSQVVTRTHGS